jgi:hypothetical protein
MFLIDTGGCRSLDLGDCGSCLMVVKLFNFHLVYLLET